MRLLLVIPFLAFSGCGEYGSTPAASLGGKPAQGQINAETAGLIAINLTQGTTKCDISFPYSSKSQNHPVMASCNDGRVGSGYARNSQPLGTFDVTFVLSGGDKGYVRVAPE